MPTNPGAVDPQSFTSFGALLRYLRRRAMLTQRELGIAVGYSEGHINRYEKNKYLPDPSTVAALFIPALDLSNESKLAARLIELVTAAHQTSPAESPAHLEFASEHIPPAAPHEITRTHALAHARARLAAERHLILCGQPGIGKTTLASALARSYAETMPVFWLTLTEGVTTSVEAWTRRLGWFLIARGQTQVKPLVAAQSKLTFDQELTLLGSALTQQLAFLCFDNAELIRCDEACLKLLQHLSMTTPTWLLLTTRESLPLVRVSEMPLEGFETAEGLAFIAQSTNSALDEKQSARLLDKVGGSPMLLHLALGQLLDPSSDVEAVIAHLETQPQVAGYLLQTLQAQSSPSAWRLLSLLGVFQQPINLYAPYLVELVETVGGIQNLGEGIEELQRRHLIGDAASARLHPFIREYVYRTLNTQTALQQRLHRLAGDWLKNANVDPVMAAMHYSRAGLPNEAIELLEENRNTIRAHGQVLSAATILDEIRPQIQRRRPNQNDLLRRLLTLRGFLLTNTLRTREGENDLREAVTLATTPAVRAIIISELAQLTSRRKDYAETLRLVEATRAELAPEDLLLHARLALIEASAYRAAGNQKESDRKETEALTLVDQMIGFPLAICDGIRARAHYGLATNATQRRDSAVAMSHIQSALALSRTAHDVATENLCLNQIGQMFHEQGDLESSISYLNQAVEGMLAIGDIHSAAYSRVSLAYNHFTRGENAQALDHAERASQTFRAVSDMSGLTTAEEMRTDCLLWDGRIQEARRVINRVLQEAEGPGTASLWGYRLRKLAMLQLLQGETDAAIATLRRALDLPTAGLRPMMRFVLHGTLAIALVVAGDPEAATHTLADAPSFEGLARFAFYERDLIEGYVALARGNTVMAQQHADHVLQRASEYPLYRQTAQQLVGAIQRSAPPSEFPRLLWVGNPIEDDKPACLPSEHKPKYFGNVTFDFL